MREDLKNIVEQLAIKGIRTAGGQQWDDVMGLMQKLVAEYIDVPKVDSWTDTKGVEYRNFSCIFKGKSSKKIVIGAHYDTFEETPGADDNGSAVAVLLCLGKLLTLEQIELPHSIELVFYACEEPPFFGTEGMGSFHHAQTCSKENTELMICLEMVGFFSEEKGSQDYPFLPLKWIYGSRGDYLMVVSNLKSVGKLNKFWKKLKSSSLSYKRFISPFKSYGMDWSDHRNYWSRGIPAIMITDTSVFRNANYHQLTDTPDTLDYDRMEKLTRDLLKLL
ncbi:MAG: M28 family peptidase [Bacteroidetes bacterium]|nr:M28 family peptidase [Bacteroidota bacterium]